MDRMERFFKMDQLLRTHRSVSREQFLNELEISAATFKRDLEYLRDRMHAPIEYDRASNGYRYTGGSDFCLPGLWLNEGEIHALLTLQHLLSNLQPGLLDEHIKPLTERITAILESSDLPLSQINRRIRLLSIGNRPVNHGFFEIISGAVLQRQRLNIRYYNRAQDSESEREISPQRLVHYRDNWYLDAWCHVRDQLRTFALESIRKAELLPTPAQDISDEKLDRLLGSGYGIFSGADTRTARLRFTPATARWVETEHWHPQQQGEYDQDGSYVLSLPYTDDRELIRDVLKYGADVEVMAPEELRERVETAVRETEAIYKK